MFRRLLSLGGGTYLGWMLGGPAGAAVGLLAGNALVPCPKKAALAWAKTQLPNAKLSVVGTKDVSGGVTQVTVRAVDGGTRDALVSVKGGQIIAAEWL